MTRAWILVVLISATFVNARWDIAVGVQHTVELLSTDEAVEVVEDVPLGKGRPSVLGYDSIRNQLYYQDAQDESIFRVNLTGNSFRRQPIVTMQTVRGIAVDPISSILYWTSDNSIKWLNVSEEITTPQDGETLISFDKDLPHGISVDVCNRFLYWTNKYDSKPSIERSDLFGRNRTVLIDKVDRPIGIFVDQLSSRLYWTEEQTSGIRHRIESADFKGLNRKVHSELDYLPLSVVVVQNKIYWLENFARKALFSIDISAGQSVSQSSKEEPTLLKTFKAVPFGIITSQQDSNLASKECKVIADKKKQLEEERKLKAGHAAVHFDNNELISKFNFCLNYGTLVAEKGECLCPEGYEGSRCEINVCHNFCVEGECRMLGGAPRCHCPPHRSGHRCQVERCAGYCLNGGKCSLVEDNALQCECAAHFTGNRCQQKLPDMSSNKMCVIYCHMQEISEEYQQLLLNTENLAPIFSKRPELCSCPEPKTEKGTAENCTGNTVTIEEINSDQCSTDNTFNNNMATLLYALAGISILLLLLVAVLAHKAWNLHKRPRIKKRIIVNKTPLTSRPQSETEQCEITIENCCNMNICETTSAFGFNEHRLLTMSSLNLKALQSPCFEPEFRKPSGKDNNKKEEKRNLLGGIELPPDDLY